MIFQRYVHAQVLKDLSQKMVFLGGPRQVGKTTFAVNLFPKDQQTYLNWDIDEHRTRILKKDLGTTPFLIFDEIHKYKRWRNYLKGLFDGIKTGSYPQKKILVTGSARLDQYRFGGDSLQGRYHYIRLLPLSYKELHGKDKSTLDSLFTYGGFPEPFSLHSEQETNRWVSEYHRRLIREDIRDLESIHDLATLELLSDRLPDTVGSPLSLNALREDLQVTHRTIQKWMMVLEKLYFVFRIMPMSIKSSPKIRAVKKEQKLYFYDWARLREASYRFENLIAVHLLKYVCWLEDTQGLNIELRYFRDTDGREVDFVVLESNKPKLFVECKLSDDEVSKSLKYLAAKHTGVPAYQVHLRGEKNYQTPEGIRVIPATEFLNQFI